MLVFYCVNFHCFHISGSSKTLETSHRKSGTYHLDLKSLLSPKFFEKLQKDKEILSKQDRKKLVVSIADDIKDNVRCVLFILYNHFFFYFFLLKTMYFDLYFVPVS